MLSSGLRPASTPPWTHHWTRKKGAESTHKQLNSIPFLLRPHRTTALDPIQQPGLEPQRTDLPSWPWLHLGRWELHLHPNAAIEPAQPGTPNDEKSRIDGRTLSKLSVPWCVLDWAKFKPPELRARGRRNALANVTENRALTYQMVQSSNTQLRNVYQLWMSGSGLLGMVNRPWLEVPKEPLQEGSRLSHPCYDPWYDLIFSISWCNLSLFFGIAIPILHWVFRTSHLNWTRTCDFFKVIVFGGIIVLITTFSLKRLDFRPEAARGDNGFVDPRFCFHLRISCHVIKKAWFSFLVIGGSLLFP